MAPIASAGITVADVLLVSSGQVNFQTFRAITLDKVEMYFFHGSRLIVLSGYAPRIAAGSTSNGWTTRTPSRS
jgi:hypothetical protein